jgi:hypothetical protein
VDTKGDLHCIDFEKIFYREDTSDVTELYDAVKGSARVMDACSQISSLTEKDIADALRDTDCLKYWFSEPAVLMDVEKAIEYFSGRLKAWKEHFKPIARVLAA